MEIAKKIVDHVYNYEFEEADKYLNKIKVKYEKHAAYTVLKSLRIYQQSVFDLDKDKADLEYLALLERSIKYADQLYKEDPKSDEAIFFELLTHSYLALYENENKNYINAATEGKRTYKYFKKGYNRKESNPEFYLSSGLLDYYIEQYPELNPSVKPLMWFFPDGDKERALRYFRLGADKAVFTSPECLSYLVHIYVKYESDFSNALLIGKECVEKYPKNLFLRARYIEALLAMKKYHEAKIEIDLLLSSDLLFFQFVGYTLNGVYYEEYRHNYEIAKNNFLKAVEIGEKNVKVTFDYLSMAYNGLGRVYDHDKDEIRAKYYFEKSLEIVEYESVKKEAKMYLKKY